ncbi:MAG: MFS transporter [Clostridia bacterium]
MEHKIGGNAKLLIASDLLYTLIAIFSETFLVAYLLKTTNESIATISIYYIIVYGLLGIGNILLGKVIKKHPARSKQLLVLGIIARALFVLFIVVLAEKTATYFIAIAILYAVSESLYWCSHELIYIDITNNNNRQKYMSVNKILGKIIKIIIPIILGSSIELYSFSKIAIYIFAISIIQILVTSLIKTQITNKEQQKYSYKAFVNMIKKNKLEKIRKYHWAGMAYGIVESSISTLIIIITMMTFKTSFHLGVLTTIFSLCSVFSLILYNKYYNKKTANKILGGCSFVLVFGVFGLLLDINKVSLVIYNFCYIITFCIFDVVYNTRKGNLVKECQVEKYSEEYIGYTSVGLTIGRVIGYLLMLVVSFTSNIIYFKLLLIVVTLFAPVYCYLIAKSEQEQ